MLQTLNREGVVLGHKAHVTRNALQLHEIPHLSQQLYRLLPPWQPLQALPTASTAAWDTNIIATGHALPTVSTAAWATKDIATKLNSTVCSASKCVLHSLLATVILLLRKQDSTQGIDRGATAVQCNTLNSTPYVVLSDAQVTTQHPSIRSYWPTDTTCQYSLALKWGPRVPLAHFWQCGPSVPFRPQQQKYM